MKYIKKYEKKEGDFEKGEYVKLRFAYGDYYNKFYKVDYYLSSMLRYHLTSLFDKTVIATSVPIENFTKCTDEEIKEIELKLSQDKYNL